VQRYSTQPSYSTGPSLLAFLFPLSAFLTLCLLLPRQLVSLGLIWLFGVGVAWIAHKPITKLLQTFWFRLGGGLALLGVLLLAKARPFPTADYIIGAVFAVWCVSLLGPWPRPGWWLTFSAGLAAVSYTLYVVHFPIQFFIASVIFRGKQFQPNVEGLLVFAGVSLLSFFVAVLMWWLFERHTDDIRRWIGARSARIPNSRF